MTGINDDLTSYADRLTRLLDAADEAKADLKELRIEIKSAGYDPAALVRVVQLRRDNKHRDETPQERAARRGGGGGGGSGGGRGRRLG